MICYVLDLYAQPTIAISVNIRFTRGSNGTTQFILCSDTLDTSVEHSVIKLISKAINQIARFSLGKAGRTYLSGGSTQLRNGAAILEEIVPKVTKIVFKENITTHPRQQPVPAPCGFQKILIVKKD
jgi:hypothetical protein